MISLPGCSAAFICTFFASAKDIISKKLSFSIDGTVSAFASFFFALPYYIVLLAILYLTGFETFTITGQFAFYIVLRSVTDTFAELLKMHALGLGDLSLVACLLSLHPLFLVITSPLITGESIPWQGVLAMVFIVLGSLLLLYRPAPAKGPAAGDEKKAFGISKKGIFLALFSAFFFSLNNCFDRLAVQQSSATLAGFSMTLLSALFLVPLLWKKPNWGNSLKRERGLFFLRGFFEVAFMVFKLIALQYLQPVYVTGIGRVSLLLSIIGGKVFFDEADFEKRLLVGILILAGILLVFWAQAVGQ